jgi:hypothetical protein
MMKEKLEWTNLDDVLNVDQMSIPYLYHSNNMLDISKKIHTRA